MDQNIETPVVEEAAEVEPKRGKVFASYMVRVTLRELPPLDGSDDYEAFAPTNADVVAIVERALSEAFDGVPSVTSERLDV